MVKKVKNVKVKPKTTMTIVEAEKFLTDPSSNKEDFRSLTSKLTDEQAAELKEAALRLNTAKQFISNIKEQRPILVEYIRTGYIGKSIYSMDGVEYKQTSRSAPYGYMAAIYNPEQKKIYIGYSLLDKEEMYPHNLIGQAFALKKALENEKDGIDADKLVKSQYNDITSRNTFLDGNAQDQLYHFKDRAARYFQPDEYSFSNGTTPIANNDFEKIKAFQLALRCINAKTNTEFGLCLSEFKNICKKLNKGLK